MCVCADSYWPGTSDTRFSCALSVVLVIATTCWQGSHKASSNTKEPLYNICIYRRRNTTFTRLFLNNEMSVSLTGFLTGSNSSGGVTGTIWPNAQADEASEDGFWGGRGTAGSLGLVAGFLRSRSGTGGGGASSRGRLSQGRFSHQVESMGDGRIQSDLGSAVKIAVPREEK